MTHESRTQSSRPRRGRSVGVVGLTILALGLVGLGIWSAGALAGDSRASSGTISLRSTDLGKVLVNSNGHTLYMFLKDRNGRSSCSGICTQYWPPLLAKAKPTAGSGVKAAWLSTVKRSDGKLQVVYRKHPLYTFFGDKRAGQTTGEGLADFGAK